MTLLVAAIEESSIWMFADAAITGGDVSWREREFDLKVMPSQDGQALLGFAGDHHHGVRSLSEAARLPAGPAAVAFLSEQSRAYPSIELAYAYMDLTGPHLLRIADGVVRELPTLHLGVTEAFDHFQRVRLDKGIDPTPQAVRTFFSASKAPSSPPEGLSRAITSMLRVFAERSERDVGGWVTPYFLTKAGAFFYSYGYAVSDPILTKIGPGAALPHGTAEGGGFGLSVTEIGNKEGVAIYWLQLPGGLIFVRTNDGYITHRVQGRPSEFAERAKAACGKNVDLFFSDDPLGPPDSITIMRDEQGIPSVAVACRGRAFSFSVLNVATPFSARAALDLAAVDHATGIEVATGQFKVTSRDDPNIISLAVTSGEITAEASIRAVELDTLIAALGEKRWKLPDPVPLDHANAVSTGAVKRELMVVNPTWQTQLPIHPTLNGITLRLRHPGFGWLAFLLPWHEAKALGEWLVKHSPAPPAGG